MRQESKKRIQTQAPQSDFNAAFSGLELSGLPDGPAEPAVSLPVWKMGRVVLRRETAHRGGKTVIVIHNFSTHQPESVIEKTAKKIRAACGCGGTVRNREIEIQGDQVAKIRTVLEADGFQVAGVKP